MLKIMIWLLLIDVFNINCEMLYAVLWSGALSIFADVHSLSLLW